MQCSHGLCGLPVTNAVQLPFCDTLLWKFGRLDHVVWRAETRGAGHITEIIDILSGYPLARRSCETTRLITAELKENWAALG
jgi:hypothetical protein